MSSADARPPGIDIAIGILAHNEQDSVAAMLDELLDQTLLTGPGPRIGRVEVIALPNGCTDDTASIMRTRFADADVADHVALRVDERDAPGKSRTWNHFVHAAAPAGAQVFVLLDADIGLPQADALEATVAALLDTPAANVAIDRILKSAATNGPRTVGERISVLASRASRKQAAIAGSLYAIRAETARAIWMPEGLAVEDGFVRAMVLTDRFTRAEDVSRVVVADGAFHTFEADSSLRAFLRHERRLVVGTMLNVYLFEHLWDLTEDPSVGDLGQYIRDQNCADPSWFADICRRRIADAGRWVIPMDTVFKRIIGLRRLPLPKKLAYLPLAVAGTVPQTVACVMANRTLRRGQGLGFW